MPRHFRALNHLVLPQGVQAGPGATNMRMDPRSVITLDDDACTNNQRFLNGRLRAGDLEELTEAQVAAAHVEAEVAKARLAALPKSDPTKPMAKPGTEAAESRAIERTASSLPKKEG